MSSRRKRDDNDHDNDNNGGKGKTGREKPAVDTSAQDVQYTGTGSENEGPTTIQEAHDRAREEERRRVEAGELRAGTEGGVPDPSIQPGTGTVTDPVPGAPNTPEQK